MMSNMSFTMNPMPFSTACLGGEGRNWAFTTNGNTTTHTAARGT